MNKPDWMKGWLGTVAFSMQPPPELKVGDWRLMPTMIGLRPVRLTRLDYEAPSVTGRAMLCGDRIDVPWMTPADRVVVGFDVDGSPLVRNPTTMQPERVDFDTLLAHITGTVFMGEGI